MRFGILGSLEVVDDLGRRFAIGGRKPSAALAILIVHRGQAVSGERLAEELWGKRAPAAVKTVQVYISRLRKALGKDVVRTRGEGYVLEGRAFLDDSSPQNRSGRIESTPAEPYDPLSVPSMSRD